LAVDHHHPPESIRYRTVRNIIQPVVINITQRCSAELALRLPRLAVFIPCNRYSNSEQLPSVR
jgi:hypothetical protein